MKQGRASHSTSGGTKVEPVSKAVPPSYPASLGSAYGNHVMDQGTVPGHSAPMYEGRGLQAPKATCGTKNSGSQGRY